MAFFSTVPLVAEMQHATENRFYSVKSEDVSTSQPLELHSLNSERRLSYFNGDGANSRGWLGSWRFLHSLLQIFLKFFLSNKLSVLVFQS